MKRISIHVLYWAAAALFLAIFIGATEETFWLTLFTVGLLLPVAIATSYTFNYILFPRYLFTGQSGKFALYATFSFILSIYLQMMVILVSFIFLAEYEFSRMNPMAVNVVNLAVGMYLVVFLSALIYLVRRWTHPEKEEIKFLLVRSDRTNANIAIESIQYIESLDNYVKIHTDKDVIITKEKISVLEEKLPRAFVRTHRSYLINHAKIVSFTKEKVQLSGIDLPISRTYKTAVLEKIS